MDILDIKHGPVFDETIWEKEYHTHNPYASSRLGNNDEIRIPIQQQDTYTLPCESYLLIQGKVTKKDGSVGVTPKLINNAVAFLFEEIRYEISGITVDSTKRVGLTSTIKSLISTPYSKKRMLRNNGWSFPPDVEANALSTGEFDAIVPLNMLLGFAEDYKRIIMNVRQELV
ncbi:hypothetical protein, partial [Klebsiella pneumoniae]|uniref:hypothetical protein n=1 Tax=Klebsiella pneumoniae TaxID=573 RepID=UPI00117B6592